MLAMYRRFLFLLIFISALLLSACFSVLPIKVKQGPTTSYYRITEVIDQVTGQKIENNALFITVERPEQDTLQFHSTNISEYNIELPIGTRVLLLIEAPGYKDWEVEFIIKADETFEGPIQMEPIEKFP